MGDQNHWMQYAGHTSSHKSGVVQMTEVKAKVGGVAKLPCGYNIHSDNPLKRYGVYWQKFVGKGQTDQVALSYWEGKKDKIDPIYQNRTTMDQRNLTLWISSVKVSDEGKYTCLILKDPLYRRELYLSVEADFSNPIINVTRHACGSALVTLRCSSYGGYPKPNMSGLLNNKEVEWTPHSVSDNQTELINITSEWEHNVTEDIFFQCTVSYPGFSASASCTIPKECPVVKPPSHWIMIAVSVSLACAVVVAALANIQRTLSNIKHPSLSKLLGTVSDQFLSV
uniref:T-lymphocyte activation antigen CD80 n=1 Tax=Euleptes europaea TaxID=460621 RepID=UPI0025426925|nr:T-lymphocyte activation antigen CD80 [Euleptes europaea]